MAQIGNTTVLPSMTLGTPLAEASGGTGVSTVLAATKTALNASGSAPVYACRAWVNFNGTGTVAIRASGNVSSITDNGVGDYTVNFTTAMPDANYAANVTGQYIASAVANIPAGGIKSTSSSVETGLVKIGFRDIDGSYLDPVVLCVSVFR